MSRKNTPFINSLPKRSPSVLTGAAFIRTRGIPSGTFVVSCYFFQTHVAMPFGVLLQNKSCPPCRPCFYHIKKSGYSHMSLPRGVRGIGKGIGWVSVSASLERLPTLQFYLLSSLLLVARGIGWVSVIHACQ